MSGWTVDIDLHEEWVDYLGHITAAAHLVIFEEARARWLMSLMEDEQPSFVVVRQELDYRRELLCSASPVSVEVRPIAIGRSSLTIVEELRSEWGVHTESRAVLVRWDRDKRRATPFLAFERAGIDELISSA